MLRYVHMACGKPLVIPTELAGKRVRCRHCGGCFVVPAATSPTPTEVHQPVPSMAPESATSGSQEGHPRSSSPIRDRLRHWRTAIQRIKPHHHRIRGRALLLFVTFVSTIAACVVAGLLLDVAWNLASIGRRFADVVSTGRGAVTPRFLVADGPALARPGMPVAANPAPAPADEQVDRQQATHTFNPWPQGKGFASYESTFNLSHYQPKGSKLYLRGLKREISPIVAGLPLVFSASHARWASHLLSSP